jgi:recombination protein RecA
LARKQRQASAAAEVAARVNAQMKGSVVTLASDPHFKLTRVPTGILSIDRLTGGGFARGRHVELYGDFSALKTYVVLRTLALAQQRGEVCAIVDAEHAFNEDWFRHLGGDPDNLIGYWPKTANELGNVLQLFLQNDAEVRGVDVVGIDSVASLLPKEELEHDFEGGDARVASLARLMSLLLRKVTTQNDDTLFLWTNQWRDKIGGMAYAQTKSTPGGKSLGFYTSTRIEMLRSERETVDMVTIKAGKEVKRKITQGQWVACQLTKDKTGARPFSTVNFMFDFNTRSIDERRELLDLGMTDGVVERKGDYFEFRQEDGTLNRVHGVPKWLKFMDSNDEAREELRTWIEATTEALGG